MPDYTDGTSIVAAVQWDGRPITANHFIGDVYEMDWRHAGKETGDQYDIFIGIRENRIICKKGEWIIKTKDDKFSVCEPSVFASTYRLAHV